MFSSIMGVVAFAPLTLTSRCTTSLHEAAGDEDGAGDTPFDVENSRRRLESMFSGPDENTDGNKNSNGNGGGGDGEDKDITKQSFSKILSDYGDGADFSLSSFPPPPPLSSIERDRRLVEIKLLECLVEGDDAVSGLWDHWYSERGSSAKSRLEKMGGLITDPRDWQDCEKGLMELVDEYGIYFVEPVNLLATLYFLQGKLKLSYKLCKIILTLKPYHIGALSGIVQVTLGLNDAIATREWAPKRLPRVPTPEDDDTSMEVENPRRVEWVEWAVTVAKDQLDQAERRTREDFFGKPETYYDNAGEDSTGAAATDNISDSKIFNDYSDDEMDDNAWQ